MKKYFIYVTLLLNMTNIQATKSKKVATISNIIKILRNHNSTNIYRHPLSVKYRYYYGRPYYGNYWSKKAQKRIMAIQAALNANRIVKQTLNYSVLSRLCLFDIPLKNSTHKMLKDLTVDDSRKVKKLYPVLESKTN